MTKHSLLKSGVFILIVGCFVISEDVFAGQGCVAHPDVSGVAFAEWFESRENLVVIKVMGGHRRPENARHGTTQFGDVTLNWPVGIYDIEFEVEEIVKLSVSPLEIEIYAIYRDKDTGFSAEYRYTTSPLDEKDTNYCVYVPRLVEGNRYMISLNDPYSPYSSMRVRGEFSEWFREVSEFFAE